LPKADSPATGCSRAWRFGGIVIGRFEQRKKQAYDGSAQEADLPTGVG